ncbi:hypothetical protein CCACVL1_20236 [Corchorus capsularis]|uniref:G-patch domain-containing protein n=1 Tax=Corchorus capsularis TaxID=210143 RepID=A0A1R3HC02_COCAP|nr:hypothetical protein CCACVL1_20236 [Corchorus capsularis]
MKLSFSLPSKPKPTQKPPISDTSAASEDQKPKEFVTEFDPSKTLNGPGSKPSFVIPPKQNEWRPYKKMKNLDLPPLNSDGSRDLQFEIDSSSSDLPDSSISYGLNVRAAKPDSDGNQGVPESAPAPVETVLLQSFKEDLKRLPDDRGFEEFEGIAIEDFGKAMLAGYGWVEGRGIGKNAKEDVKVKQYGRRQGREGLGFDSKEILNGSKNVKEKQPEKEVRVKHEAEDDFPAGIDVRVIEGRDMGFKGTIIKKLDGNRVVLRLKNNNEEVKIHTSQIANLGSREEEKCLRKLKELKIREGKDSKHKGDERKDKRSRNSERSETKVNVERVIKSNGDRGVSWLRNHIRVRVISKDLEGGRLYLKKGQVVDVIQPYICDILMDESRKLVRGVEQELLETALPKPGGPVLVLYGRHKDVYGSLMERDRDRETGIVRDADSHELVNVKLEQIAEFVGDPSELQY